MISDKIKRKEIFPDWSQYLFVRIPRTASTSICHALQRPVEHKTALEWKAQLPDFDSRFKFSVVRNPYDRFVSMFYFFGFMVGSGFTLNEFAHKMDLEKMCATEHQGKMVIRSQYEYLYDGNKLMVDEVGKYEDLSKLWKIIQQRLGVKEDLPVMRRCMFVKEELDQESKDRIYTYYQKDFEVFGYER